MLGVFRAASLRATILPLARPQQSLWAMPAGLVRLYSDNQFHDPVEHVTGIEKRELLAHMAGDCDPFRILSIKRGPGTRERPNLIPSSLNKRLMACCCSPSDNHVEYMWLHKGVPKRCGCGYWFELCPVAPL